MLVRAEVNTDTDAISGVVTRAFKNHPFSAGTERSIVLSLRAASALAVSLVAEEQSQLIGHVAFSLVAVSDGAQHWYGLGPLAVEPRSQGRGVGSALMQAGLAKLPTLGAAGCVVLGDPAYYGRFGFESYAGLVYPGPAPEHFMALAFKGNVPNGQVAYHAAFSEA